MANRTVWLMLLSVLSFCGCAVSTTDTRSTDSSKRNVILFLGDGMGVSTVTAARIHAGQLLGGPGEDHVLSFETFPNVALIKTYNTDGQVSDSAGTMSAIVTGEKTRIGFISVAANVSRNDCPRALENELPTLLEMAEDRGFATGAITTARITHATPAATFAHTPNRNWEADTSLPADAAEAGCRDIARQLVEFDHGDGIDVVLGGGRAQFHTTTQMDPEYPGQSGVRADGRDLIETWLQAGSGNRHYLWNQAQFDALPDDGAQVLGLFEPSHMQFEVDRPADAAGEPSLTEMTRVAIERLQQADRGFFLTVEGGRIDHAHHAGNAYRALNDAVEFARAVQMAMDKTDARDTLILVTADHSHSFTMSGYPRRGNPILGKVETPLGQLAKDARGRPYTTLGYGNGPGFVEPLPDLTSVDTEAPNYQQVAAVPMAAETHAGEDVAAYAQGPNADTLRGVLEQNALFEVMRAALFDGPKIDGPN